MKYHVGQKVRIVKGDGNCNFENVGKIVKIARKSYDGWDIDYGNGIPQGNWEEQYLEPVNAFEPPFCVDCPTQEIWDKVMLKARKEYGEEVKKRAFKKGDMVKNKSTEEIDTVESVPGMTEYDRYNYINASQGFELTKSGWQFQKHWKLITPVEEKEEKHKNLVAEYPLPPMYTLTNDWTNGGGYVSFGVDLGTEQVNPFYKFSKSIMDTLRTIPARIKKLLSDELQKMYQLDWINANLEPTSRGIQALNEFLFDKYEKELGAIAKEKVEEAEKAMKEKEEDED